MSDKISTADARKNFSEIINKVAYGDESFVITRQGKDVAALVSIDELKFLQEIEDLIDIKDALKSLNEPGENISANEFWKKLGL